MNQLKRFYLIVRVLLKTDQSNQFLTGGSKPVLGIDPSSPAYGVLATLLKIVVLIGLVIYSVMMGLTLEGITPSFTAATGGAIQLAVLFVLLFGTYYAAVSLFFAKDLPSYLSLPLSATELVGAKFASFLLSMFSLVVIFVPALITIGVLKGVSTSTVVAAVLVAALSLVPSTCVIVGITFLLLKFTPLGKNKDLFISIFGVVSILAVLGFVYVWYSTGLAFSIGGRSAEIGTSSSPVVSTIGNHVAVRVIVVMFSPLALIAPLLTSSTGILQLFWVLASLAVTALYLVVLFFFAQRYYLDAAKEFQAALIGRKALSVQQVHSKIGQSSPLKMLLKLNWMRVRRSPFLIQQYIIGPAAATLMIGIMSFFGFKEVYLAEADEFKNLEQFMEWLLRPDIFPYTLACGFALSLAFGAFLFIFSGYGMSAVSVDGTDFYLMKAMPVAYKHYLLAKIALSLMLSSPALVIFLLVLIVIKTPLVLMSLYTAGFILGGITSQGISMFIDVTSPKLDWETETQLKNRFLRVYALLFITLVMCALYLAPAGLLTFFGISALVVGLVVLTIALLLVAAVGLLLFGLGPRLLRRIES